MEQKIPLETYVIPVDAMKVNVIIYKTPLEVVPIYQIDILSISKFTGVILKKIREEFVSKISLGKIDISGFEGMDQIKQKFKDEVQLLVTKYFPTLDANGKSVLITYVLQQDLGLGNIEILLKDSLLEEVVINGANEPVWVYHRHHGWLKTNVIIESEDRIRHYSIMIGKEVNKEITLLNPLMDAHLKTGDRVNATLKPISAGNTITIRKFAVKPWSIVDLLKANTISYPGAAFIWMALQNELSTIIAGGTASGKTSMLNAIANFFPPNQRILSIEDTRELTLPNTLHWVPLETRLPNPEGKGEITMLDLVVNSLRMRPDRIMVGEIRRKKEAEVLFEAMHTGHSVYGTVHATNAHEAIVRLTSPPIDIPKSVLPALSMIIVQNRNRRTGLRRTLQIAEVLPSGDENVLMQYDATSDKFNKMNESTSIMERLNLFTGMTIQELNKDLSEKENILKDLVKRNVNDVHEIGKAMAEYYTRDNLKR